MNQGTKQRIVGTVVLLTLALIFLPIVFDGEGSYQTPLASRIPAVPLITILPDPVPSRPVIIADSDAINIPTPEPAVAAVTEPTNGAVASPAPAAVANDTTDLSGAAEVTTSQPVFSREIPTLDSSGLPEGWSVRLGSFSDSANADGLLKRLQAAGYRAYIRRLGDGQAALTGVYVGPWIERARVDEYQKQLQQEFQLAGIVVRYEVEQL